MKKITDINSFWYQSKILQSSSMAVRIAQELSIGIAAASATFSCMRAYHQLNLGKPLSEFDKKSAMIKSLYAGAGLVLIRNPRAIIGTAVRLYQSAMAKNPAATGIATTGVSYMLGEVIAQKIAIAKGDRKEIDYKRLATITVYGFVLAGPIYYKFFQGIDKVPYLLWRFKDRIHLGEIKRLAQIAQHRGMTFSAAELAANPLSPVTKIASKIFVDQVLFSAPYTAFFLFTTSVMLGKTIDEAWKEMKSKFVHIYLYDCAFWPPGQLLNYGLIPAHLRQAVFSALNLTWNTILCLLSAGH
jgi:hypothetical protein